jgi:hypothetical protein
LVPFLAGESTSPADRLMPEKQKPRGRWGPRGLTSQGFRDPSAQQQGQQAQAQDVALTNHRSPFTDYCIGSRGPRQQQIGLVAVPTIVGLS